MHEENGTDPKIVRAHVARITASDLFAGSGRLRRFLTFTVEARLEGRAADIKEFTLGREVFDRGESYDPRVDPIVRVEARRLRSRLAEYYNGPGRDEPFRIAYPTGSYVPFIHAAETHEKPVPKVRLRWIASVAVLCIAATVVIVAANRPQESLTIAPIPETWIQQNDGSLDTADAALAEDVDAALANDPSARVVAWPVIAQRNYDASDGLRQVASTLGAPRLLIVLVRDLGALRRINVFVVDEPSGRKRLSLTYYADATLGQFAVRDRYARRIAHDLSAQHFI